MKKAQDKAAQAFVTAGGTLKKYMRDNLINGKMHEPHPKVVKMNGRYVEWNKKSFPVANAKLGGSVLLRANGFEDLKNLNCNFYLTLSGVPGGQENLDLQAPSKDVAEMWVMGVLACIEDSKVTAAARLHGKPSIFEAARSGDVALVQDHLTADASCVNSRNASW